MVVVNFYIFVPKGQGCISVDDLRRVLNDLGDSMGPDEVMYHLYIFRSILLQALYTLMFCGILLTP